MNRLGLALSGGGFRAMLYHLGLVRFLRDAGILSQVTHITSVSGGSIIAAHLVLNWDRYNGSPNEFDAAASELLSFVRLDVRNRIARRFPLCLPVRLAAPAAGTLESQADADGAAGIPLREVSLRRHQPVRAAGTAGTAHPRHQPERGMPLLLQPERPADGAPATEGTAFASTASTSGWPPCRWPSPPRRPSPGSSRRSSSPARTSAPAAASSAGSRTPTAASSTTSASACSAAWNGRSWRRLPCPATTSSIFKPSSRHCARQASPARKRRFAGSVRSWWRLAADRTCCR